MTTADDLEVYWSGWIAGLHGDDPRTCPHEKLTHEWRVWQRWHGFGVEYATAAGMFEHESNVVAFKRT